MKYKEIKPKNLIGKTIIDAEIIQPNKNYDDVNHLVLKFSDNTIVTVIGDYGSYTGQSSDEYQTKISVNKIIK